MFKVESTIITAETNKAEAVLNVLASVYGVSDLEEISKSFGCTSGERSSGFVDGVYFCSWSGFAGSIHRIEAMVEEIPSGKLMVFIGETI